MVAEMQTDVIALLYICSNEPCSIFFLANTNKMGPGAF